MNQTFLELSNLISPFDYQYLNRIGELTLKIFPQHKASIFNHFGDLTNEQLLLANDIAKNIFQIAGAEIEEYIEDYKWTCELMLQSEIYFRRKKKYPINNFDDVLNSIYNQETKVKKYLRGLLLSQILWRQQLGPTFVYSSFFLKSLNSSTLNANVKFLEIGPGHGLWLGIASRQLKFAELHGWDVSAQAINETKHLMVKQNIDDDNVTLAVADVCKIPKTQHNFNAIAVSQVLEIVPDLNKAVENISKLLSHSGKVFINAPIKSVSPDHIRRWESGEEVDQIFSSYKLHKRKSWHFTAKKFDNIKKANYTYCAIFEKT